MIETPDVIEAAALDRAVHAVQSQIGSWKAATAIVLGSGLTFLAERISDPIRIAYRDIPGFPMPTIQGHRGELVIGRLAGVPVLVQSGRFHMYEGHSAHVCALPVRVFSRLGIGTVMFTNAAGGVRRTFTPGTLMLIADHVNLTFRNPLSGPVLTGEERFPDMSDPYDHSLRTLAMEAAARCRINLETGVYAGLLGPSYETPAEVRMLDRLGADAVGMSTVVEVIAARALGMRCLAISTITNAAAGIGPTKLSHVDVLQAAERVKDDVARLIEGILARI